MGRQGGSAQTHKVPQTCAQVQEKSLNNMTTRNNMTKAEDEENLMGRACRKKEKKDTHIHRDVCACVCECENI